MKRTCASLVVGMVLASMAHAQAPDTATLAKKIDAYLTRQFQAEKIEPAPKASDAEFLRRAYLDLTGRIPRAADVRAFLADRDGNKRQRLVERLIDDPRYAIHFARVWRAALLPEVTANRGVELFQPGFEAWLVQRLRAGDGYDVMVRDLLNAPIASVGKEAEPVLRDPNRPNPLAFFAVKEAKPENLAAGVTRTFLGIQLECAQCHDHPFAKWKQDQFWSQAAFFAGIERQGNSLFAPLVEDVQRQSLPAPGGKKMLPARFLDGAAPITKNARAALADWVTSRDNPFFAKAMVNRLWGQFFGFGLVEPIDDFRDDNPATSPELLDELANAFVASNFDGQFLMRAICLTQAYQRSSAQTDPSQMETKLPARMPLKALTAEQLFDSLAQATGYREEQDKGQWRRQLLSRFQLTGPIGEPETSVQQALMLRNGAFFAWAADAQRCPTLIATTQTPGMNFSERVDVLYLATLSRFPSEREREILTSAFERRPQASESDRLSDVMSILLNCAEFRLNH